MGDDKQARAEEAKTRGNAFFKKKDFANAVAAYTEAIDVDSTNETLYSNRSAAFLKINQKEKALADAKKCTELKPEWSKGYSRQGSALYMMGKYAEAVAIYAQGLIHDASDSTLAKGLAAAQSELSARKNKKSKQDKKVRQDNTKADEEDPDDEDVTEYIIGIDLGTTYSCVGVWLDNGVKILETSEGSRTIPSYVSFMEDGNRFTGMSAKNQVTRNARNTIYDIKRIIGQRFSDNGVTADVDRMPYTVTEEDGKLAIVVDTPEGKKSYAPQEISAMVLQTCKELAEKELGVPVNKAVITVPAYFNDAQRNATKAAGTIAGLEVMRIINEPTAAALSYGLDNRSEAKGAMNVLIFDLGGGTFDVSILTIDDGIFTVKATGGDTRLGGEDFDQNLINHLLGEASKLNIEDPKTMPKEFQRVRKAAEQAKRTLSQAQTADIRLDAFTKANVNFSTKVTREKFENLNKSQFLMCMDTVKRVLKDAKMKTDDIDEIVLVGGSTRIPKIQSMLSEMFGGKTLCKSVNPDEAVAYGAAVQGAILNGKRNARTDNLLLMDVTPLSLGIETTGRVMSVIIPRNTPIPCVKTQTYTTEHNYQTKVDVSVYEGERLKSDENNLLGEFTISGIESAKRGEPQVEVSFAIDSDGVLTVTAIDQKTKAKADIEIANRSEMSKEEIERMVADAAKYKKEDEERMRRLEAKNELERVIGEVMDVSKETEDSKLAGILEAAADKEQIWLEENGETASSTDIAVRRRALYRRIENRARN